MKFKGQKRKIEVLTKEEVKKVFNGSTNIRDKFLIKLLFETGLKASEVCSLYIEDIIFDHKNGHKIKVINRDKDQSKKRYNREIYISQELIDFFDDYAYEILDELNSDNKLVFVKLNKEKKVEPLTYKDINDIFKRLRIATGVNIDTYILRYTHANIYYKATKEIKHVQERLGHLSVKTTINMCNSL